MYEINEQEIKSLKAKYGDIFMLKIEDKSCILKKPSRKVLSYATSVAAKDPMKFNEIMLNDCFVAGDEEIKTDDSYFLAAASKISELIEVKESELVKL